MDNHHFMKKYIKLMNTDIYCEYIINDKPAIILIHGLVESSYTYRPIMPLLEQHFSVIAFDLPGFGRSEKSTTFHYSYANYANLVIACLDHFKLDHVYLAGHSMGGQIAMYATRRIPNRVDKLVLISSSAYLGRVPKWLRILSHLPFFHLAAKYVVQKNGVQETLENVLYDKSLITDEMVEEYGLPLKKKKFYKALTRFIRHREGDLRRGEVREIDTPTLLIWGEKDNVVSLAAGKQLAEDLPNSKLVTYEKAGHLITEERPDEIYAQIKDWCLPGD